jgi:choline dehydrogenase-like flavoprotein
LAAPDVEFHFAPSLFFDDGLTAPADHGYCFGPVVIKPTSRGRVMLRTPLPDSKPRVLCNFLTTEEDRTSMLAGMRLALEVAAQAPLRGVERAPFSVPQSDSDQDLMAFVRRAGQSVYHPTSTCAMGSVVDAELRVYGFEGLRVVDASVMPEITRGNTNAPVIMIAERAADLIRAGSQTPAAAGMV